jgi:ABC-type transport system substrate-binding protein/streptogramin lyase
MRERLRGQMMVALYRSGRQADALETYRAGRALLVEELAVEPGPELRKLQLAILKQDTALVFPAPAVGGPAEMLPTRPDDAALGEPRAAQDEPSPAGVAGRRRRGGRWAVLVAGVGATAGVLALAPLVNPEHAHGQVHGNVLALISPASGALLATVPMRAQPTSVAAGSGSVWVAETAAGLIARVDPGRRAVVAAIPVGTDPSRVIAAGGQVWVLDPADRTLTRIDPQTNTVAQIIAIDGQPSDVLLSAGSLWVATRGGTVLRIEPGTGRTENRFRTGGDPASLAAAGGAIWVATDESGTIERINPQTGAVTSSIRVGDAPADLSAGAAGLWVLDPLDATVSRVDPRRAAVVATVPLGGAPVAVAQSGGSVWIADADGTLLRLVPGRGAVTRFRPGGRLSALTAAGGSLWAAVGPAGPSHRGGTLTSISSYAAIDTIDPAASTSPNVSPPQLFGLTSDGLVTLNHAAGEAGTRLVPDLAMSLPVPASGGRTYTFRMRPWIRYSTGALVKPSDVTHSFERLFQLRSSGAAYYQTIVGAAACQQAPRNCDLSHGIAADNRRGTVTFHLTRPDPDFLYKLTLAYADVLPASVAGRQAQAPLPATGPYMITRYNPGRELILVRNPRFREWSAAAQPGGYPDRIMIRLDLSAPQGAAAAARGTADFMPNLGQIPADASYFLRHRGQLRINPQMITGFLFLNVHVPPFNQLRVRQAVNLALDRRKVVNGYGGPLAAQPTCQILPPGLPGYRRYCPYTRDPATNGRWHGPDLARARRLVAASGTTGMKVTVWDTPTPQANLTEARDTVAALRQLGYRASLRLLPDSTYFTYTNDSRNHAQVIDAGWGADYPSADDFIGKLTCDYFVPGNGQATTDASEFCDPALDREAARAATRQTTDPLTAAALWARLDDQLTNLAIWLPTVTPNETDLISGRVRNYLYNPVWGALMDQLHLR